MDDLLDKAFDPEIFRKNGHELIDLLSDYLTECGGKTGLKVLPWKDPELLKKEWNEYDSEGKKEDPLSLFKKIIEGSIHLHNPKNMGHQVVPPAPLAALADLLGAFLNNSMAVYEVGPASTVIETIVIEWLISKLGMGESAGGILTSGGTIGNLTALLAARQNRAGYNIWEEGYDKQKRFSIMVSPESHYSISRAIKIMGLGESSIIKLPVTKERKIDHNLLESCYTDAVKGGTKVIAIVANACTTSTGSYDPLLKISEFCRKHDIWLHIDAAHGGGAVLSEKYKYLTEGIELADSIVIDFHKMLLSPALTTAVIFRDGNDAYETFSQKASYLLNEKKRDWYDIAERTLECTKKMMGIKVYVLLKIYGDELFSDYITRAYDLAADFGNIIEKSVDFELGVIPNSNIVCFRYIPDGADITDLNFFNKKIREHIKDDGEFYIVQTEIDGNTYLRTTLMNPFTTLDHLQKLLQKIREIKI